MNLLRGPHRRREWCTACRWTAHSPRIHPADRVAPHRSPPARGLPRWQRSAAQRAAARILRARLRGFPSPPPGSGGGSSRFRSRSPGPGHAGRDRPMRAGHLPLACQVPGPSPVAARGRSTDPRVQASVATIRRRSRSPASRPARGTLVAAPETRSRDHRPGPPCRHAAGSKPAPCTAQPASRSLARGVAGACRAPVRTERAAQTCGPDTVIMARPAASTVIVYAG